MRIAWMCVTGMLGAMLAGCGRAEAPAAATGAPSVHADGPSVVTLPADSPQLKQIRVEAVQLADMPTGELVAPARVVPNPNPLSPFLPPLHGPLTPPMAP